jgi:hypothetical protein
LEARIDKDARASHARHDPAMKSSASQDGDPKNRAEKRSKNRQLIATNAS